MPGTGTCSSGCVRQSLEFEGTTGPVVEAFGIRDSLRISGFNRLEEPGSGTKPFLLS